MNSLELTQVTYQDQEQLIVAPLDLVVPQGAFLTLVGPSGSGKSTVLKLIASLLTPSKGEIVFESKPQSAYDYTTYRQAVSYCFQQPTLFGKTVRDNLEFPYIVRDQKPEEQQMIQALAKVDLAPSYLDKKITQLSGGERQRVALIRNVLFPPKVLLLDEVTVGLDEESKKIVQQLIRELSEQNITIIQVTHDQSEIEAAKQIIELKGGKLV
ncbi:ABC transporter ATP-binding protein [Enterococcus bulliens]